MTTDEARREAARLLLGKADDSLAAAERERDLSPATAINRAYYACFYAASAVLISQGRKFVRHSGVRNAVHKYLVKEGRIPAELGAAYNELMTDRQQADYEAVVLWAPEDARKAVEMADRIVTALRLLLP